MHVKTREISYMLISFEKACETTRMFKIISRANQDNNNKTL